MTSNVGDQDNEEAVEFVAEASTSTIVLEEDDEEEIFVENTVKLETNEKD